MRKDLGAHNEVEPAWDQIERILQQGRESAWAVVFFPVFHEFHEVVAELLISSQMVKKVGTTGRPLN